MKKIILFLFLIISIYAKSQIVSNPQFKDTICTFSKLIICCKITSETPQIFNIAFISDGIMKEVGIQKKNVEWYVYNSKKTILGTSESNANLATALNIKTDTSQINSGNELTKAGKSVFIGIGLSVIGGVTTYLGFYIYNKKTLENENWVLKNPKYKAAYQVDKKKIETNRTITVGVGIASGVVGIAFFYNAWNHIIRAGQKNHYNSNSTGLFINPNLNGVSLVYKF